MTAEMKKEMAGIFRGVFGVSAKENQHVKRSAVVLTSPDFVAFVGALSLRALLFLSFRVAAVFLGRAVLLLVCFPLLSHNHAACEGARGRRPPSPAPK